MELFQAVTKHTWHSVFNREMLAVMNVLIESLHIIHLAHFI